MNVGVPTIVSRIEHIHHDRYVVSSQDALFDIKVPNNGKPCQVRRVVKPQGSRSHLRLAGEKARAQAILDLRQALWAEGILFSTPFIR